MEKKRQEKPAASAPHGKAQPKRAQPEEQAPAAEQMGATEQQVLPLMPPMAESDQAPSQAGRKTGVDEEIDPSEELTPG